MDSMKLKTNGIVVRSSKYTVKETIDQLQVFLEQHGTIIYARIDQQAEVQRTGQQLLPLELIVFGNPRAGGALMAKHPLVALDLPLKVIAWEDEAHKVWLAYNTAAYIGERYSLEPDPQSPLHLDKLITAVLGDPE